MDDFCPRVLPVAASIIGDPKDWLCISCALYENTIIWSHDLDLGTQKRIRIISTKELIDIIGSLS